MNSQERFFAALARQATDRPLCWLGMPMPEALPGLFKFFKVKSVPELRKLLDDDFYVVDIPYDNPPANHIACAFDFSSPASSTYEGRTLTEQGFFAGKTNPESVEDFPWPDPTEHIDIQKCKEMASTVPAGKIGLGVMWSAHFQDACAAFGMEEALIAMITEPEMYKAVLDRIIEFYLKANEIFYNAVKGKIQAVLLGNDFGTQKGLLVGPDVLRSLVFPGIKRLIAQAHDHDLKVIYHSCGSIEPVIDDMIEAGADVIHPIQPCSPEMAADKLQIKYAHRTTFCGGLDVQQLMTQGTPDDVKNEIRRLKKIFKTGLIFSPSHEALMADVPPENVAAMFEECKTHDCSACVTE